MTVFINTKYNENIPDSVCVTETCPYEIRYREKSIYMKAYNPLKDNNPFAKSPQIKFLLKNNRGLVFKVINYDLMDYSVTEAAMKVFNENYDQIEN